MMVRIRQMRPDDIDKVYAIECECFSHPWSKEAFLNEINQRLAFYLVVEKDGEVVGFAGVWLILDEGHITNIAIKKAFQGQGLGYLLTAKLLVEIKRKGIHKITLEVRKSNTKARSLYKKLGFVEAGERKNYYSQPTEDGIIMWYQQETRV